MESDIKDFLYSISFTAPFFVIYFIGLILSFVFRERLGRKWLVSVFAFLVHMLAMSIAITNQIVFHFYIIPSRNYEFYSPIAYVAIFTSIFLQIIGYAILFVALFGRRTEEAKIGL